MRYPLALFALAVTLLLGGCGQMGPLYEPQDEAAVPHAPATQAPTQAP
jgi:predicted small lipoprotein YifL